MLSFLGRGKGGGGVWWRRIRLGPVVRRASTGRARVEPGRRRRGGDLAAGDARGPHRSRGCVAWEPQGRSLATCSSDKTVRLWAPSRAAGGAWVTVAELEGVHNRTVRSVAWSPCGASVSRLNLTTCLSPRVAAPRTHRPPPRPHRSPSRPRVPASPRPTPRHREFRRQHRRVGAAGRRVGVRRRGGGPRERGGILRVVPQRPALGHVRPR